MIGQRFMSVAGILVLLGIAFLFSNNRRRIRWSIVSWGFGLQLTFALLILKTELGRALFMFGNLLVNRLLSFTDAGASFLFGKYYYTTREIVENLGAGGPYQLIDASTGSYVDIGIVFAIHILPTIIFFSAFISILYHLGIMQWIVERIAWVMAKTLKTSGVESLSCASNIFVGQTEAPLLIKPFIKDATQSELMAIMVGGFATIAGGVMAAYVRFGVEAGHLLSASVMSAPAALMIAKIMFPETEHAATAGQVHIKAEHSTANVLDAAALGAKDGLGLALNVGAMLLAFIALIAMFNFFLGHLDELLNWITFYQFNFQFNLSLASIFGFILRPLALLMGVSWKDAAHFAQLLGTKISINELIAYVDLVGLKSTLEPRTFTIATYALCGFANFSSIAIQIGGISALAPERRSDLAAIGLKAMFGGAIASWLTACIIGIII